MHILSILPLKLSRYFSLGFYYTKNYLRVFYKQYAAQNNLVLPLE